MYKYTSMLYGMLFLGSTVLPLSCMILEQQTGVVSKLELFPNKGLRKVVLGYPYYAPTVEEKASMKYVRQGHVVSLEKEGSCALVGACQPCEAIICDNGSKTFVAHLSAPAGLESLINIVKQETEEINWPHITGSLFTNKSPFYATNPVMLVDDRSYTWQKVYQDRTQEAEMKQNKDILIREFGIQDRTQIKASIFTSKLKDWELGRYELAELFLLIKKTADGYSTYNTCPVAENFFKVSQALSIKERVSKVQEELRAIDAINPFYEQYKVIEDTLSYGKFDFIKDEPYFITQ